MKTSITRITFGVVAVHTNASTDVPVRVFNGYVSDDIPGQTYMAGSFSVHAVAFGDYGEYPFFATQ